MRCSIMSALIAKVLISGFPEYKGLIKFILMHMRLIISRTLENAILLFNYYFTVWPCGYHIELTEIGTSWGCG